MLRYFSLGAILLCANFSAHAASYQLEPVQEAERTWAVGFQALYLNQTQPTYAYAFLVDPPPFTPVSQETIKASDEFAFRLDASYFFHENLDITVNWLRLHSDNNASASSDNGGFFVVPFPISPIPIGVYDAVNASLDSKWDVVNLEVGRTMPLATGSPWNIRLHAGVQFANLDVDLTANGIGSNPAFDNTHKNTQRFFGVGPRIGMDNSYELVNGLSIVGNVSAAVLVGDLKWKASSTGNPFDPISVSNTSTNTIPTAEGRVGLQYDFKVTDTVGMTIEGGYHIAHYFDMLRVAESIADTDGTKTGFGYNGPYLGLRLVG